MFKLQRFPKFYNIIGKKIFLSRSFYEIHLSVYIMLAQNIEFSQKYIYKANKNSPKLSFCSSNQLIVHLRFMCSPDPPPLSAIILDILSFFVLPSHHESENSK